MPPLEMPVLARTRNVFRRLSTMGPHELAHRIREKGYSELERIGLRPDDSEASTGANFKRYLSDTASHRFYRGTQEPLLALRQEQFPSWIERAVQEADKLCRHEVSLLAYGTVNLGAQIDWHRDPVTGRTWERRFWADYRPETKHAGRDAKIIHELNRHQHLPRLAKAWKLTGDERYAAEAVSQLLSWIDQNPPGMGINWQSSLEIGIRAISWLWTIFLLLPSQAFDEATVQRVGDSLFAQLDHVYRHTSLYSSPNTHLIGEAAALFIAGLVFRDRKRPVAWLETGAAILAEEAKNQFLDAGVHGELSSYYHCYALDFYLQSLILAEQNEYPFPSQIRQKVIGMLEFLMHLTRPDGSVPPLGDADGGRVLALQETDYHSSRDALCVGAIVLDRPDLKYVSGAFSEDALWFLGGDSWRRYSCLKIEPPRETEGIYPAAGYAIQRSGWGELDSQLVFDFGGLGMFTGGHAHADSLSFTLFGRGKELLADPGTFVYNCAPAWRNYFRSTRAHNTVTIDGSDQAESMGTFSWKTRISSRGSREVGYMEGEHDGYSRLGVNHRRRVIYLPPGYWIITDEFRGSGTHTFDFHYHFGPKLGIAGLWQEQSEVVTEDAATGLLLGLYASLPLKAELINGQAEPIGGWVSQGYGEKRPSKSLRARIAGPAPATALTVVSPLQTPPALKRLSVETGNAIACSCEHDGFVDVAVVATDDSEITVGNLHLCGEFFWARTENGIVTQTRAIHATRFEREGQDLLEDALCAPSAGS